MSEALPEQDAESMDLAELERRVEALLARVEQLARENRSLRDRHENLLSERARLIDKTETARTRVEAMIMRLKTMERD